MDVQDSLAMSRSRNADSTASQESEGDPDQDFQPFDPDYSDFDDDLGEAEEFGGYGHYDFEDPEHTEGGGDFELPSWQRIRRDEL